jgi:hypothetical protein
LFRLWRAKRERGTLNVWRRLSPDFVILEFHFASKETYRWAEVVTAECFGVVCLLHEIWKIGDYSN